MERKYTKKLMKNSGMSHHLFFFWAVCMGLLAGSCQKKTELVEHVEAKGTFYGLGNLPSHNGNVFSNALGVSPDGNAVVGISSSFVPDHLYQAFIWTRQDKEMRGLKGLSGGYIGSGASAVSNGGRAVAGDINSYGTPIKAVRWEGNLLTVLNPPNSPNYGYAYGISADGSVLVGLYDQRPFRWSAGDGLVLLDDGNTGGHSHPAYDVSNDGSIIAGEWNDEAFRWENGVLTRLGVLEGGYYSSANAISPEGSVVVGDSWKKLPDGERIREAFRWEHGVMKGLGRFPGLEGYKTVSQANDVSAYGAIVVGNYYYETGPIIYRDSIEAFIWTKAGGVQNLQAVLKSEYGLELPGWRLISANGISDDGTVIAGEGCNVNREVSVENGDCEVGGKRGIREAWVVYLDYPLTPIVPPTGNHPPVVTISSPQNGGSFTTAELITFSGSAEDEEQGSLTESALVWTSDIDGEIGTGVSFSHKLSAGRHTVSLKATDADGDNGSASVTIEVQAAGTATGYELALEMGGNNDGNLSIGSPGIITLLVRHSGDNAASGVWVTNELPEGFTFNRVDSISHGSFDNATGIWNIGAMQPGTRAYLQIHATATKTGTWTDKASITAGLAQEDDPDNNNGSVSFTIVE